MLIAQLTDLHLRPPGLPANRVVETNAFAARAFAALAAMRPAPDVVVISGDLADRGEPAAYELLAQLITRYLTMPCYVIPGNHDDREAMRGPLGPYLAGSGEFLHGVVETLPVRLILLDSLVPGQPHGLLCDARLAFLEAALSAAPGTPAAIILHHPPIDTGILHMDEMKLLDAGAFAGVLARHGQVQGIWCGHIHRNISGMLGAVPVHIAPSAAHSVAFDLGGAPAALVMEPPAFLLHRWQGEAGFATHNVFVEPYPGPYPFLDD